jgi:hypothetical protein
MGQRIASAYRSRRVPKGFRPREHTGLDYYAGEAWRQYVGACTGFSFAKLLGAVALAAGHRCPEFSAFFFYSLAHKLGGLPSDRDGAYVEDVARIANKVGTCEESRWPSHTLGYRDQKKHRHRLPPQSIVLHAQKWRKLLGVRAHRIVGKGSRLAERILHSLDKGQGVLLSLKSTGPNYWNPNGLDPIQPDDETGNTGHMVACVDWIETAQGPALLLVESKGPTHGQNGRKVLSLAYVIRHAEGAYYLTVRSPK